MGYHLQYYRFFALAIVLIIISCTYIVAAPTYHEKTKFKVFDALIYLSKPDLTLYGLENNTVTHPHQIKYWGYGADPVADQPSELETREIAAALTSSTIQPYHYVDIENLPTRIGDTELEWSMSMQKLSSILTWLKNERPTLTLGLYAILPVQKNGDYNELWRGRNTYFHPLSIYVDYVAPSLYTFSDNHDAWIEYATENIAEARKYAKPIYPFIWPHYHNNAPMAGQLIDGPYWRLQLETLYNIGVDGVIIWGGNTLEWADYTNETDPNNWWFQTLDFMKSKGLN